MANVIREIKEGKQSQGANEQITYTLTVPTTWGTPTGTPTVTGYTCIGGKLDGHNYVGGTLTDVTSTIFPTGVASVSSQDITLPECVSLTAGILYMVTVLFDTSEGDTLEAYAFIEGDR